MLSEEKETALKSLGIKTGYDIVWLICVVPNFICVKNELGFISYGSYVNAKWDIKKIEIVFSNKKPNGEIDVYLRYSNYETEQSMEDLVADALIDLNKREML